MDAAPAVMAIGQVPGHPEMGLHLGLVLANGQFLIDEIEAKLQGISLAK